MLGAAACALLLLVAAAVSNNWRSVTGFLAASEETAAANAAPAAAEDTTLIAEAVPAVQERDAAGEGASEGTIEASAVDDPTGEATPPASQAEPDPADAGPDLADSAEPSTSSPVAEDAASTLPEEAAFAEPASVDVAESDPPIGNQPADASVEVAEAATAGSDAAEEESAAAETPAPVEDAAEAGVADGEPVSADADAPRPLVLPALPTAEEQIAAVTPAHVPLPDGAAPGAHNGAARSPRQIGADTITQIEPTEEAPNAPPPPLATASAGTGAADIGTAETGAPPPALSGPDPRATERQERLGQSATADAAPPPEDDSPELAEGAQAGEATDVAESGLTELAPPGAAPDTAEVRIPRPRPADAPAYAVAAAEQVEPVAQPQHWSAASPAASPAPMVAMEAAPGPPVLYEAPAQGGVRGYYSAREMAERRAALERQRAYYPYRRLEIIGRVPGW
jgi:hypothetical protein